MLARLWLSGKITVATRQGGQKVWDLTERVLPEWAPRQRYSERKTTALAIEHALRALGPATTRQIQMHFVRYRYPEFEAAFKDLRRAGRVVPVSVAGLAGEWWLHADQVGWLDEPAAPRNSVAPRTVLLSPFDNLIADRTRTERLFGFEFRIEIYTPIVKRKYGYYVLPILHGERLIGRIDPQMDRLTGTLRVNAVFSEPGAPRSAGPEVAGRDPRAWGLSRRAVDHNRPQEDSSGLAGRVDGNFKRSECPEVLGGRFPPRTSGHSRCLTVKWLDDRGPQLTVARGPSSVVHQSS